MESKICTKCKNELSLDNFSKRKSHKDGLEYTCKGCINELNKQNYVKYKESIDKHVKVYQSENKPKILLLRESNREKAREYAREWRKEDKNKEKRRLFNETNKISIQICNKKYRKNNKAKVDELRKNWEDDHKEIRLLYHKQYAKDHSDEYHIRNQRRYAMKLSLPASLTLQQWESIKLNFNNKCCYCGKELPLEMEHFIPVTSAGEYTINNIIPSCKSCNCSKSNKVFKDWYPTYKDYSKKREDIILKFLGYSYNEQQLKIF